jgi:hypothetical protein
VLSGIRCSADMPGHDERLLTSSIVVKWGVAVRNATVCRACLDLGLSALRATDRPNADTIV